MLLRTRAAVALATQAKLAVPAANPAKQEVRPVPQIATSKNVSVVIAPALPKAKPLVSNPIRKVQVADSKGARAIEVAVGRAPATNSPAAQAALSQVKQEVRAAHQSAATETLKAVALALRAANRAVDPEVRAPVVDSRAALVVKAAVEANLPLRVARRVVVS